MIGHFEPIDSTCVECASFAVEQDYFEAEICEEHLIETMACEYADRAVKMAKEDELIYE